MTRLLEQFEHRRLRLAAAVASALIVAACASTPPAPTESMVAARTAISEAEKADAGRYAAPELGEAREKLAAADSAIAKKSMIGAQRLAEQSQVEAQLASAKSGAAKATAINDEMKTSNNALFDELQRNTGKQP
jgi:hypothetical protein